LVCIIGIGSALVSSIDIVGAIISWLGAKGVEHEAKRPTIKQERKIFLQKLCKFCLGNLMTLLLLEALLALLILIGIVWWTMFSGRTKGEIRDQIKADKNNELE
jgi:hypothetical protein